MRRLLIAFAAACVAVLALPATGSSALSCGVPQSQPAWIDFADGSV